MSLRNTRRRPDYSELAFTRQLGFEPRYPFGNGLARKLRFRGPRAKPEVSRPAQYQVVPLPHVCRCQFRDLANIKYLPSSRGACSSRFPEILWISAMNRDILAETGLLSDIRDPRSTRLCHGGIQLIKITRFKNLPFTKLLLTPPKYIQQ